MMILLSHTTKDIGNCYINVILKNLIKCPYLANLFKEIKGIITLFK